MGLKNHFQRCGNIIDVRIATNLNTGNSRGFAHIEFETYEGVLEALKIANE